jgi:hypothetical protein
VNPSRSQRKKRLSRALHVPRWYYLVLGAIAVVGVGLIVLSTQVRTVGITTDGDYFMGSADAPVTIIDWGSFG